MKKRSGSGRNPTEKELREAERVLQLHPLQQKTHPSAIPADHAKLAHINTYGSLPDFYLDQPFICRVCGKREIWKATDQKWYYEDAKGHIDARAVECHHCRKAKKSKEAPQQKKA
ncbi:MAG TPA: zinc-ribbon domain containing protein [Candidatus Competibacteraceae bacterium]|nr:zinc-ribbon domain containing protein [Candidatus Competibacteraceae bacterium]MCP5132455.1 zinc-ribbon domain containing protein [Gammaproteobacteria bacterium]HPF59773.1 zinc-ribbon domain containing protein [Candidatus Competibacteraceae bacterium]HRY18497.1 zinc-ribbon domain containing protein [Candidatus Competibacteraceae bacterium]